MCCCRPGFNKQQQCPACRNKFIPDDAFGALLGVLWDSWGEAKTPLCLSGLVWGTVFTVLVISAVRWMCSSDKCFPWWSPYLTTSHLLPETDDDLKLPPSLTPLYFGLAPGSLWLHCLHAGYLLLITVWGLFPSHNSWIKCPFLLLLMRSRCGWKWVWNPCSLSLRNIFEIKRETLTQLRRAQTESNYGYFWQVLLFFWVRKRLFCLFVYFNMLKWKQSSCLHCFFLEQLLFPKSQGSKMQWKCDKTRHLRYPQILKEKGKCHRAVIHSRRIALPSAQYQKHCVTTFKLQ